MSANASIYRNGLVKARNGSVYKHYSDFYHLTMVNLPVKPRIYQSSGFYSNKYTHLSVGTFMSAKEAQLATCELEHLHWAGHCPLTPSTTDSRSKISTSKYNIMLCYIANAPWLARFAVATAVAGGPIFQDCCLGTVGKYIYLLICLLLYQLPILFECGHDNSISARPTNFFIIIRTGDKRSKIAIKYLCGSKNSQTQ